MKARIKTEKYINKCLSSIYMASERWKRSNKSVYNVGYHLIWCPKYRRKVLINPVDKELKKLLLIKAKEINVEIEKMVE